MRRKLGILFFIGITVLAGTQEATRQFDGLKSSLKNFTRASLWSGLIVYAQPVSDGKLPTPQIYYLMPAPQQMPAAPTAQQQPVLADNGANTTAVRPDARNNHGGEAAAVSNPEAVALVETREIEDAAKSEMALNKLPLNLIASHFAAPHAAPQQVAPPVAPKPDRVRVYEEVARHTPPAARKFRQDADMFAKVFVKEPDAAKLVAETEHLVVEQAHLERLKLKTLEEAASMHRRMELRVMRRHARSERLERLKVIGRMSETRGVMLPEMSSIGCEKTRVTPKVAPVPPAAPLATTSAPLVIELPVELGLPAASHTTGNSWALNCDTEPEQK